MLEWTVFALFGSALLLTLLLLLAGFSLRANRHEASVPEAVTSRVVKVRMRIDEHHFSRAPFGMSSRKPASTGGSSAVSEAATIIPLDSRPRSFRGCRFATITTCRPSRRSGS